MYELFSNELVYLILSAVVVFPVIVVIFEEIICGFSDFVYSFVSRVKKKRVVEADPIKPLINSRSQRGMFDLYTRWRSRIRKNVFKIYD